MGIVSWIVLGAIAGFVASALVGGRGGLIGTVLLGIVGAVVGGYLAESVLHQPGVTGLNLDSVVVAVIGAVVVLLAWNALRRSRI
jgi:uncharacterized membrane protein YeaQ/YmgE (transglycosylase-associated protein family)